MMPDWLSVCMTSLLVAGIVRVSEATLWELLRV